MTTTKTLRSVFLWLASFANAGVRKSISGYFCLFRSWPVKMKYVMLLMLFLAIAGIVMTRAIYEWIASLIQSSHQEYSLLFSYHAMLENGAFFNKKATILVLLGQQNKVVPLNKRTPFQNGTMGATGALFSLEPCPFNKRTLYWSLGHHFFHIKGLEKVPLCRVELFWCPWDNIFNLFWGKLPFSLKGTILVPLWHCF